MFSLLLSFYANLFVLKYIEIAKNAYLIIGSFMLTFILLTFILVLVLIFIKEKLSYV
ncbi:hypothetical protein BHY_1051 (plasmid) [Borrelia nietonii YOR]|uniref:Uncharacterized protein n=2 Tax=Borrelia TaxID=138 RepID=W5SAL7_9SPIR|nr:hypothetical protein BHY_1051 [Borrelia nietonii YOR]AHH14568.1 hypothetical protein BHW_0900024 [Borrelia hermsii MTW]